MEVYLLDNREITLPDCQTRNNIRGNFCANLLKIYSHLMSTDMRKCQIHILILICVYIASPMLYIDDDSVFMSLVLRQDREK